MAFTRMYTKQHKQGSKIEDFIFHKLQQKGLELYRQRQAKEKFLLPKRVKRYISQASVPFLENYPFDFFLIENGKLSIVDVKSKAVTFSKDDRKLDVSSTQLKKFQYLEVRGMQIKILVVWIWNKKYYYQFHNFKDLKVIGKKKLKIKIPQDCVYSPKNVNYEELK